MGKLGRPGNGVKMVSTLVRHNEALEHIDLSGNRLRESGVNLVAEALCHNTGLASLDLSQNGLAYHLRMPRLEEGAERLETFNGIDLGAVDSAGRLDLSELGAKRGIAAYELAWLCARVASAWNA